MKSMHLTEYKAELNKFSKDVLIEFIARQSWILFSNGRSPFDELLEVHYELAMDKVKAKIDKIMEEKIPVPPAVDPTDTLEEKIRKNLACFDAIRQTQKRSKRLSVLWAEWDKYMKLRYNENEPVTAGKG